MLKVAVTGASGLVGSRIIELLNPEVTFIPLNQEEFDITNQKNVETTLQKLDFDIFLHLAAYTLVDETEKQKKLAFQINVEGTKNVFDAVVKKNKKFIYISTDFVFDGSTSPYFEDSLPNPISYYGQTKYDGEKIVKDKAMIVRICFPYRAKYELKKDFVRSIISNLKNNKLLDMVTDAAITPTFIDDIALSLKFLLLNFKPEIYHLVGNDYLTPYEAAKLIAKVFDLDDSLIHKTTYSKYNKNKAKRPQYAQIRSEKNDFYKMRTFEEGLIEIKRQISNF